MSAATDPPDGPRPAATSRAVPRRTLIVDDTADLREALVLTLAGEEDFAVVAQSGDGRDAIDCAAREHPDVVLLDLAMPVMDGLEALPHLRRTCPRATIVVLSGFGVTAMRDRALASGADGYVEKGTRIPAMVDRLRRIAQECEARRGVLRTGTDPVPAPSGDSNVTEPYDAAAVLVEHAPAAMLLADPGDGVVRHANAAARQLLGISAGPLSSLSDQLPELWSALDAQDEGDSAPRVRVEVERDGATLLVEGRPVGGAVLVHAWPVSSRDEAARLRSGLATVARELRIPVSVLLAIPEAWDVAAGDGSEANRQAALLASVDRQATRLARLTADLIAAAEARDGVLDVRRQPIDLRAALEVALAAHPEVALHVLGRDGDPSAPLVVALDEARFVHLLDNLLDNASQHGSPPVRVTVTGRGPWAQVEVEDQGLGVPESLREELFEELTCGSGAAGRGTGLGLFVARRLALAHEGDIRHRNGTDRGSVFTVTLPLEVLPSKELPSGGVPVEGLTPETGEG